MVGVVTQLDATTWRGQATGPGGTGTLTLTGTVRSLAATPCCETASTLPPDARHRLDFRWATARGTLTGCIDTTIWRRPHGRWVWDGTGLVTGATEGLATYLGRGIAIAGRTSVSDTTTARIILSDEGRPSGGC